MVMASVLPSVFLAQVLLQSWEFSTWQCTIHTTTIAGASWKDREKWVANNLKASVHVSELKR